jgi:hypothetical protein
VPQKVERLTVAHLLELKRLVVPWVINGNNFILRGSKDVPNLLEINYKFCKKMNALSETPDGWPETGGQSHS